MHLLWTMLIALRVIEWVSGRSRALLYPVVLGERGVRLAHGYSSQRSRRAIITHSMELSAFGSHIKPGARPRSGTSNLWVRHRRVARSSPPGSAALGACHWCPREQPTPPFLPTRPNPNVLPPSHAAQVIIPPEFMSKDNKRVSRRRRAATGACGVVWGWSRCGCRESDRAHHERAWRSSSSSGLGLAGPAGEIGRRRWRVVRVNPKAVRSG